MATFFTDFGSESTGALGNSSDWATARLSGDWTADVTADAGATGGKTVIVKDVVWGDNGIQCVTHESTPSGGTTGDVEIVANLKVSTVEAGDYPIGIAFISTTDNQDIYAVSYKGSGTWLVSYFQNGGIWEGIGSTTGNILTPSADTYFWIRLTRNGTTIKANVWSGAAGDEPAGFNVAGGTHSTLTTVKSGIAQIRAAYDTTIDVCGVGTDGDKSAPTSSGGGLSIPIAAAYYRQMRER